MKNPNVIAVLLAALVLASPVAGGAAGLSGAVSRATPTTIAARQTEAHRAPKTFRGSSDQRPTSDPNTVDPDCKVVRWCGMLCRRTSGGGRMRCNTNRVVGPVCLGRAECIQYF